MTNPELEQPNKTDGDLDGLDDKRLHTTGVPEIADDTHSAQPCEPTATHGPHMRQYFARTRVAAPTPDLATVAP